MTRSSLPTIRAVTLAMAMILGACGGEALIESEELVAADELATIDSALTGSVTIGSTLKTTANLNMRSGPSTSYGVLIVVPKGAQVVTVERTTPSSGFYKVKYSGKTGWCSGSYLTLVSSPSTPTARDNAITRARSGVGFSYWWGHGRFRPEGPTSSTRGSCTGDCPSCTHGGSYGADCSGYVAKIWAVGSGNTDLTVDRHPYSTYNFTYERHGWHSVSRSSLRKADALTYNSNGSGHVMLFESGDGWGSLWAYEAKGCSYGIVRNLRTVPSTYRGIAHDNW